MELHIFEEKGLVFNLQIHSTLKDYSWWTDIDIKITYFKIKIMKMKKQVTYTRIKLREQCST